MTVRNTGLCVGSEIVQLYIQDISASVARPVRELKGFQKVALDPGEEKEVTFTITEDMLRFTNINMKFESEAGRFYAYIGNSSETQNKVEFLLE